MRYLPPILALLALFLLLIGLMALGWRRRARRQADPALGALPAPPPLDPCVAEASQDALPGVYVATTTAASHLDRITAHGLGARSRVLVTAPGDGPDAAWRLERVGAPSFEIPASCVRAVTVAPGMVGKWIGGDGLLVIRWELGGTLLDTGLRLDSRTDHDRLLASASPTKEPA